MAGTTVSITIAEGDVPKVVKAICKRAGLPVANANAKPALVKMVTQWVVEELHAEASVQSPVIE